MCLLEPISVTPNILSVDDQIVYQFESLLQAISFEFMGNSHPTIAAAALPPAYHHDEERSSSSLPSSTSTSRSRHTKDKPDGIKQLSNMVTFILGGPVPPTPGSIPLCWEELVDWTEEASALANAAYTYESSSAKNIKGITPSMKIRFVPFVSAHESEAALKNLASQTYMERAQFYQESVIIAVQDEAGGTLCLVSLFQFCRHFTLCRRLADSHSLIVLDTQVEKDRVAKPPSNQGGLSFPEAAEKEASLLSTNALSNNSQNTSTKDPLSTLDSPPLVVETRDMPAECAICMDKPEDSVLQCCSHALCHRCEKRWVRKRLCCPFCRQAFASAKQAATTQWDLSVTAVPVDQIRKDIHSLEQKIYQFWISARAGKQNDTELASILADNYVQRPKTVQSIVTDEADGFIVVQELAGIVV